MKKIVIPDAAVYIAVAAIFIIDILGACFTADKLWLCILFCISAICTLIIGISAVQSNKRIEALEKEHSYFEDNVLHLAR